MQKNRNQIKTDQTVKLNNQNAHKSGHTTHRESKSRKMSPNLLLNKNKSSISLQSIKSKHKIHNDEQYKAQQAIKQQLLKQDKKTPQFQLFESIYQHKYVKSSMVDISVKNRTFANKGKPQIQQQPDYGIAKNKSVGSLLPKLKQLQVIAKSDKKQRMKSNNKQQSPQLRHISPLQVYMNRKDIKKQDQLKLLFITQHLTAAGQPKRLSDKVLNQQFSEFVFRNRPSQIKNLRFILNLADSGDLNDQQKHVKIQEQKKQLTEIMKQIINIHYNAHQNILQMQQYERKADSKLNEAEQNNKDSYQKKKDIKWVLKQCRLYDKKFKITKTKTQKISANKSEPKLSTTNTANTAKKAINTVNTANTAINTAVNTTKTAINTVQQTQQI